jgi:iron-sulfur cluster assembly protein
MATGVSITDCAVEKIKQQLAAEKREGQGLRVKVVGGGCSGLQNKLDFDTSRAGDKVFEKDGAKVLVDMKSLLYLNGTELDYKDGLMQSGFVLQNPNVKAVLWMWRLLYGLARAKGAWFQKVVPRYNVRIED